MYRINTILHGKCFARCLRTRSCIANVTRSLRSLVLFLIRQQLVRKYRTHALPSHEVFCKILGTKKMTTTNQHQQTNTAQPGSVKVFAPKSPLSCDNRSPTRYQRRADVVGEHRVNMNFPTSVHFLQIAESRQQSGYLDKGPMEFFPRGCRGWRWHHEEPNKLL